MITAERTRTKVHGVPIGTIYVNTWGYDQTNVNFYQVVATTAKTVTIRAIQKRITQSDGYSSMSGHATPIKDAFEKGVLAETMTKRVGHGDRLSMQYGACSKWEGRPVYVSWYA
jgi:hypothetical protein